jgi:hypothetical protein
MLLRQPEAALGDGRDAYAAELAIALQERITSIHSRLSRMKYGVKGNKVVSTPGLFNAI